MNELINNIGVLAGVFAILGYIPYIISILRGKTLPSQASWLIWALIGGILAFSYIAEGDKGTIWLPLSYFLGPLVISALSFFYGHPIWNRLDIFCLVAALMSLIFLLFSRNTLITLLLSIVIDMLGTTPTLVKTFRDPESEDFTSWLIFFLANTIEIFALREWNLASSYPFYLFLLAGSIFSILLINKLRKQFVA